MSTDFTPTHRTTSAIGNIKAGSLIRVAQYNDIGFFSHVLGRLGVKDDAIEYNYPYGDEDVQFWDPSVLGSTTRLVLPGDYIITDGEHFEVSNTGYGWDLLTKQQSEGVSLSSWGSGLYTLRGDEGGEIKLAASQLYELIQVIQNRVPKPSPVKDARFISAFNQTTGEYQVLAKFDGVWYDDNGFEHTEKQVLEDYDEIKVIR